MRLADLGEDLLLADLFKRWPATIPVFIKNRMVCVGCPMTRFNTLSDAIRIYNLSRETFLQELVHAINEKEGHEGHS